MKKTITKIINKLGYQITKLPPLKDGNKTFDPFSKLITSPHSVIDLESLESIALTIPGMISPQSGKMLFTLCYLQSMQGDVVEIGSWQGRSTSFLARAVEQSSNGKFYAIDHFRGNVGKEKHYIVKKDDLSDLKVGFLENIKSLGLEDAVNLLDMTNEKAVEKLNDITIRFLFIDGDHTFEGVKKDIELFFPMLTKGSIVVFDDFTEKFPGVVKAVNTLLNEKKISKKFTFHNTLVLEL